MHAKTHGDERIHEQVDEGGDEQRFEVFEWRILDFLGISKKRPVPSGPGRGGTVLACYCQ